MNINHIFCCVGDVRLVDGTTEMSGKVILYKEGRWGSVCDDGWSDTEATVVCQQLFGQG